MKAAEIRNSFLRYFEKNAHTIIESSSLVPQNDPTLLFTNAGMVQFKDVFLGKDQRSYKRATSSQKCVRAGGKHNDLENVGFTARHNTFFEMLGNFSFGDYFKKEAIHFAWEYVTQELKLPKDKLYVSVYEKDDEAAELWQKEAGLTKDRIYRFGDKDNFWAMGETGPCGPCSEIFIDRGEKAGCGKPTCGMGCDCDRYLEFWNLVFMQYDRDASGKLTPLPRPSVDTGAGLERIASIIQGVESNYDTDLFQGIITQISQQISALGFAPYERHSDLAVSFRVIADHARAATFLIGDGVLPSNEGRGYVLRRIMRRAIRHGKKLGFDKAFLHQVTGFVIEQMQEAYPDLRDKKSFIAKVTQAEEEQFLKTLERGLILLDEETQKLSSGSTLAGEVAFKLYDTFGFPLDLTRVICLERKLQIDEIGFQKAMDRQRSESRKNWKGSGEQALDDVYLKLAQELKAVKKMPRFVGYDKLIQKSPCSALLFPDAKGLKSITEFETPLHLTPETTPLIEMVFEETPFYGESGGQTGDRGVISGPDGFEADVIDSQKPTPDLIVLHVQPRKGRIRVGDLCEQKTDRLIRSLTARNHTCTHLLHWALRKTLGTHVKQAGSLVSPEVLRFDFSHFQAMTSEELTQVENLVNEKIWLDEEVSKLEMSKDEAIAQGAIAFFGEKYSDRVRVIRVGDFSSELCGGTHVNRTAEIHLFKIANESGIAAGVRRIVASTSKGAFEYLRGKDREVKLIRDRLKASSSDEILGKIEKMDLTEKDLRRELEKFSAQSMNLEIAEWLSSAEIIQGVTCIIGTCLPDTQGIKKMRDYADRIKQKAACSVMVLGIEDPETKKPSLLVALGKDAPPKLNSNEILGKLAPLIEGKGGGKREMAQAGGNKVGSLEQALKTATEIVKKTL